MAYIFTAGKFTADDDAGNPLVGGLLYTYASGTTTPKATYTSATLGTANTNPITLDARGEAAVWLGSGAYTMVLKTSAGVTIWTQDGIQDTGLATQIAVDDGHSGSLFTNLQGYINYISASGTSLIGFIQRGANAVSRTLQSKNEELVTSADFGSTGVVQATDEAAIQNAAAAANSSGGNKCFKINSNVSQAIDIASLSLPSTVLIEDDRFVRDGWKTWHSEGEDAQLLLRGRATASGEGPAFTLQNLASTGNRNVSFVHWYGSSSVTVASFEHWGYNSDGTWYPGREWIGKGTVDTGFRARTRWDGNGAFLINPNGDPDSYKNNPAKGFVDGYIYTINAPLQTGYASSGKYLFGLHTGKLDLNVELRVQSNARMAFQSGNGPTAVDRWGIIPGFPSTNQLSVYDYIAGANKLVFTSGGDTSHGGVFKPLSDNVSSLGSGANRWSVVYAATGVINTSDARYKQDVRDVTEAEKAVAVAIKSKIKAFRFKDAVAQKGDAARFHIGVIAQEVAQAFTDNGLDPNKYAMFCNDTWTNEDGVTMDRMGVRYEELLSFVLASI